MGNSMVRMGGNIRIGEASDGTKRVLVSGRQGGSAATASNAQRAGIKSALDLRDEVSSSLGVPAGRQGGGLYGTGGQYGRAYGSPAFSGQTMPFNKLMEDLPYEVKYQMFLDIYHHDAVAGTAVDFLADLPASNIRVIPKAGRQNELIEQKIMEVFESLNIVELQKDAFRTHYAFGSTQFLLIFNEELNMITHTMPISYRNCSVESGPFYRGFPKVEVKIDEGIKRFFKARESFIVEETQGMMPQTVMDWINEGVAELNPSSCVYMPRLMTIESDIGVSIFERLLPLHVFESTLMKATNVLAQRNIAGRTHISVGTSDRTPQAEELDDLVRLVMEADRDPIGAVFATLDHVDISRIDEPSGWKILEVMPDLDARKLVAMRLTESIFSNDVTYNNQEQALNMALKQALAQRLFGQQIILDKIVAITLGVNGFTKKAYGDNSNVVTAGMGRVEGFAFNDDLYKPHFGFGSSAARMRLGDIPNFNRRDYVDVGYDYEVKLSPTANDELVEALNAMTDQNFPVPLRTWAAAVGINFSDLMADFEMSVEDVKKINEVKQEIEALSPQGEQEDDGFGNRFGAADRPRQLRDGTPIEHGHYNRPGLWIPKRNTGIIQRPPLLSRKFSEEAGELYRTTATGKREYVHNQERAQKHQNELIIDAVYKRQLQEENRSVSTKPGSGK